MDVQLHIHEGPHPPEHVERFMLLVEESRRPPDVSAYIHELEEYIAWLLGDVGNRVGEMVNIAVQATVAAATYGAYRALRAAGEESDAEAVTEAASNVSNFVRAHLLGDLAD